MAKHPATKAIQQSLGETLQQDFDLISWDPVSGGSIHQAWSVQTACGRIFFIKTNQTNKFHTLEAEALGLKELKQHITSENPLRTPDVYALGHDETYAWLVLSYIEFGQSNSASEQALGRGLALLHKQTADTFGFTADNVIGESLQTNQQNHNWLDFFKHQRLGTQFKLAKTNGFYNTFAQEAEQLLEVLPILLADHNPMPSLLHGDLWSGNKGTDTQGNPIIFDPAVYYGDQECDLAMTELFGGFPNTFYAAYDDVSPRLQGYQQRKELYNLYHILNHANIFGGHYIQQSKEIICRSFTR